jgi:hypothetical protein
MAGVAVCPVQRRQHNGDCMEQFGGDYRVNLQWFERRGQIWGALYWHAMLYRQFQNALCKVPLALCDQLGGRVQERELGPVAERNGSIAL